MKALVHPERRKVSRRFSEGYFRVMGCRVQEATIWMALMGLAFLLDWYF